MRQTGIQRCARGCCCQPREADVDQLPHARLPLPLGAQLRALLGVCSLVQPPLLVPLHAAHYRSITLPAAVMHFFKRV